MATWGKSLHPWWYLKGIDAALRFSGGCGSAQLMVGLYGLRGLFQP